MLRSSQKPAAVAILSIVVSAVGASCSKSPEADGTIAEVNGEIVVLTAEEEEKVCSTTYCEPNYIYEASFGKSKPKPQPNPTSAPTPAPTPAPAQPSPSTDPSVDLVDYSKELLGVPDAWTHTKGDPSVVVAVIDSGVEITHPDLRLNIWGNGKEYWGRPGVDDDGDGYVDDVYGYDFANNRPNGVDDNRHGTHCAGIIAAADNGFGTIGVAPNVKIMPLKFLAADGRGSAANAIRAINYAVKHGAKVISNSWGGVGYSQLMAKAIKNATDRGILFVAAAGNEKRDNDKTPAYPANYPGVISVASTTSADALSSFSNFGSETTLIAAPGSNIYSTVLKKSYGYLSGTSMATPQVSGALALAGTLRPDMSADELKTLLCMTSKPILLDKVGCGRLDVRKFLNTVATR